LKLFLDKPIQGHDVRRGDLHVFEDIPWERVFIDVERVAEDLLPLFFGVFSALEVLLDLLQVLKSLLNLPPSPP
jgi:hypothetical protein